ncbi:glycosyltransferase family 4 protein [uncultured Aquimarina sp.]|uniref:glycosyltransferase family 4 protein n=1 Tax=uncultured Aquimarina sp. TaxID=575652 RepID=UPI00260955E3|nr:glycosyltransferase family 4 protein [uncultured Aquimarina sp.]
MDKVFLDLNYYTEKIKKPDLLIKKFNYSLGYLPYLSQKIQTISLNRIAVDFSTLKEGVKYIFYKGGKIRKYSIPFAYHNFINELSPDYILIHGMGYGRYCYFLRRQLRKKVMILVQVQGYAEAPKGFKKWIYTLSDKYIDGYLFTGKENAKDWIESKVFAEDKVFEVMEGATNFRFNPEVKRKEKTFLWVGRLDENKDPITVLKAFQQYLIKEPLATLTMIYNGFQLLEQVNELLSSNTLLKQAVNNVGRLDRKEIESLYQTHQYFVLGSHYEGSGFALAEAMTCGCVPIVTNIPSFNYMTNYGSCALLFEPGNREQLFSAFCETKMINYLEKQSKVLQCVNEKLTHKAIAEEIHQTFIHLESKKQE